MELKDPDPPRRAWDPVVVPGPLDRMAAGYRAPRSVCRVFCISVIVFGLVGAQMSWVLRPFVLAPTAAFALFRPRGSNIFRAVFDKAVARCNGATPSRKGSRW